MILSENWFPLFGIMRIRRTRRERGGNCHIGPHWRKAKTWAQGKGSSCEAAGLADNDAMTRAGKNHQKPDKSGGRSERLAAALRENLRRRKAQERQRGAPESRPKSAPAPHDDKGG